MRNPAKTPPVFDPRTIDPNRVPTGLKVLIAASFMIAVGFGLVAPVLRTMRRTLMPLSRWRRWWFCIGDYAPDFCAVGGSADYPLG